MVRDSRPGERYDGRRKLAGNNGQLVGQQGRVLPVGPGVDLGGGSCAGPPPDRRAAPMPYLAESSRRLWPATTAIHLAKMHSAATAISSRINGVAHLPRRSQDVQAQEWSKCADEGDQRYPSDQNGDNHQRRLVLRHSAEPVGIG